MLSLPRFSGSYVCMPICVRKYTSAYAYTRARAYGGSGISYCIASFLPRSLPASSSFPRIFQGVFLLRHSVLLKF